MRAEVAAALAAAAPAPVVTTTVEQKHLTLSGWQKLGAFIVILAVVIGAAGMATYGYVAAHDWGCKTGALQNGCPAVNAGPQRPDIPASRINSIRFQLSTAARARGAGVL